ncbi:MAG: DUF885 domain-containing protein [Acidobacteria bacterium]|nr:DUF885 domain-containing protein [Acidobacteriota bacterium]MBV9476765.1 DUF885 domain-containing protein [Acidobacteriota bacterium]
MRRLTLAFVVLSLAACATTPPPAPAPAAVAATPTATPAPNAASTLARLVDAYWQHRLEQDVNARAELGLPIEHLPDFSYAHEETEATFAQSLLAQLDGIDENALAEDDRITLAVLKNLQQQTIDGLPHFYLHWWVTPYASPIRGIGLAIVSMPLATADERARYVRLVGEYGTFLDGIAEITREQQRRGILLPKPELPLVRAMIAGLRRPPEESMFAREGDAAFTAQVREAIATRVNPALSRILEIFSPAYETAAPAGVGLAQYPGGAAAYRELVRESTTLDLDPREIHELGLREVERINREMADVRTQLGFTGTKAQFHQFLRTDPRFFATSAEEIGARLTSYVRRIEPQIPKYFARLPRAPYDVQRLDPALEGGMTFGYYDAPKAHQTTGHYYFNGSKPNERSLLFAGALMLHELIPGHHFQIARQLEDETIPLFRRRSFHTVFVEGWGEYSAWLGNELGLYSDPYDHYGRLMMDAMLSSRLVVDTGMKPSAGRASARSSSCARTR